MNYILYLAKQMDNRWCFGIIIEDTHSLPPMILLFKKSIDLNLLYSKSKKRKQLYRFIQQLLFFQQVHLTLAQSIQCLNQSQHKTIPKFILNDIELKLHQGIDFVSILENHSFFFEKLLISQIDLGLKGGQLTKSLNIWLDYQNQTQQLYQAVKQQLFYPGLVFVTACGFLIFFVLSVLPKYQQLFKQFHLDFPASANFILQNADVFHAIMFVCISALVAIFYKKIPGINHLLKTLHWYQWCEQMYMSQQSGLNLADSLMLIQDHIPKDLKSWHNQTLQEIRLGMPFLDSLQKAHSMPAILKDFLILIHHQANNSKHFYHAAYLLKKRLEQYLSFIENYLQPLLLLIISLFCASLFYLLYLPLLELGKNI